MNPKRTFRYYYLKFTRLQGDPKYLARGTAVGTFLGITPIIPFHTVLNLLVTFLTRTSPIAAILASVIVCNPLTYIPQYYFSIVIGNAATPYEFSWERMKAVLDIIVAKPGIMESLHALAGLGYEAVIVLLVGGSILALPFTVVGYYMSLQLFLKIREKKRKKHILNYR
ncbi:hypothetical protein UWK_02629 [Desulfocapsa sulfexigens DSM 10523]|uniref:DUF2062 domain-containing protein n=1 Tax=Desulfocapsa sulfexigens (strain DSM 10523 / SB164P1) TaxID=1167006 RepID=M1PHT8_DESSD|nr:DUF2062 domain-containing protein [Desulfocapsa sulfexigens]AGF79165.1 hypothetical protein UWK_02629 [Desulfocapsa sulfexigens DSM 10523]